jgi:hypothetical protein
MAVIPFGFGFSFFPLSFGGDSVKIRQPESGVGICRGEREEERGCGRKMRERGGCSDLIFLLMFF